MAPNHAAEVSLVGLDFGTTTSSAVVADASLLRNAVTGRTQLSGVRERFRSALVFTPRAGDRIDIPRIEAYLDAWFAAGAVQTDTVFGGGALLTGLTARQENAAALVALVRRRLGDTLVAAADDPCLESWLSFLGSCGPLSRTHPDRLFLNLDIGGGTTNFALGRDGQVLCTGCLVIGARHVECSPGTYRIVRLSQHGQALLARLGIGKNAAEALTDAEVAAIVDHYVRLLEAAALGDQAAFGDQRDAALVQVPFQPRANLGTPIVTLSGGVGELIYAHLRGERWQPTTQFGDLGIDLARRLLQSPVLGRDLRTHVPAGGGRATVFGLLRHNTEISGSTLFLPRPKVLPLIDLPVLGRVTPDTPDADMANMVERVRRSSRGGCLFVSLPADGAAVRALGHRLASALRKTAFPPRHPLVLLVAQNLGKVFGHYVTEWRRLPVDVVVVDEVPVRDAHYVRLGSLRGEVVPVSFHGLYESQDSAR
jgi:ethanolamine utilization protein EutA